MEQEKEEKREEILSENKLSEEEMIKIRGGYTRMEDVRTSEANGFEVMPD